MQGFAAYTKSRPVLSPQLRGRLTIVKIKALRAIEVLDLEETLPVRPVRDAHPLGLAGVCVRS